ncbi:MAG: hypothetical protein M1839_003312 [Geoglossum umbratile]|nr:MAG: hypothetical protein M1839_003312 [Geoglossum umbratile]
MSTSVFKASGPSTGTSGKGPRVKYVKPFGADPPKRQSIGPSAVNRNTIRYQGKHNATCSACRDYGELTDCDTCRRAWHNRCVKGGGEPPLNNTEKPPEFWRCPICIGKIENIPALSTPVPPPKLNTPVPVPKIDTAASDITTSSLPSSAATMPAQTPAQRRPSVSPSDHASKRRKIDPPVTRSESEPAKGERRSLKLVLKSIPGSTPRAGDILGGQPVAATDERNGAPAANISAPIELAQVDDKPLPAEPTSLVTTEAGSATNTKANGILSPPLNPVRAAITTPSRAPPPSAALQALDTPTPSPHPTSTPTNLITGLQLYLNQVCDKLVESEGMIQGLEHELEAHRISLQKAREDEERLKGENEALRRRLDIIKRAVEE